MISHLNTHEYATTIEFECQKCHRLHGDQAELETCDCSEVLKESTNGQQKFICPHEVPILSSNNGKYTKKCGAIFQGQYAKDNFV